MLHLKIISPFDFVVDVHFTNIDSQKRRLAAWHLLLSSSPALVMGLRSGGERWGRAWCAGCGAGAGGTGCGDDAGDVGLSRLPSALTGASPAFCCAKRSCLRNFARRFWNHTWKYKTLFVNLSLQRLLFLIYLDNQWNYFKYLTILHTKKITY